MKFVEKKANDLFNLVRYQHNRHMPYFFCWVLVNRSIWYLVDIIVNNFVGQLLVSNGITFNKNKYFVNKKK